MKTSNVNVHNSIINVILKNSVKGHVFFWKQKILWDNILYLCKFLSKVYYKYVTVESTIYLNKGAKYKVQGTRQSVLTTLSCYFLFLI